MRSTSGSSTYTLRVALLETRKKQSLHSMVDGWFLTRDAHTPVDFQRSIFIFQDVLDDLAIKNFLEVLGDQIVFLLRSELFGRHVDGRLDAGEKDDKKRWKEERRGCARLYK